MGPPHSVWWTEEGGPVGGYSPAAALWPGCSSSRSLVSATPEGFPLLWETLLLGLAAYDTLVVATVETLFDYRATTRSLPVLMGNAGALSGTLFVVDFIVRTIRHFDVNAKKASLQS